MAWRGWPDALLTAETVGMRIGNEVRGAMDWVLDRDGMGVSPWWDLEGSEVH